jgi:hypothetical protein
MTVGPKLSFSMLRFVKKREIMLSVLLLVTAVIIIHYASRKE